MYLNSFWLSEFHDTVLVSLSTGNPTGFSTFQTVNSLVNIFLYISQKIRNKEQSHDTEVANKTKLKQPSIFFFLPFKTFVVDFCKNIFTQ